MKRGIVDLIGIFSLTGTTCVSGKWRNLLDAERPYDDPRQRFSLPLVGLCANWSVQDVVVPLPCEASLDPFKVMQMPLFESLFSCSATGIGQCIRKSLHVACGLAVLTYQGMSLAGEKSGNVEMPAVMQASKLRLEARLAAERGDFVTAASTLETAALKVGDRDTASRARDSHAKLEAGGGSQADFQSLMMLIMEQTSPPALWIQNGDDIGSMTPFLQGVFVGIPAMAGAITMTSDNSRLISASTMARTANHNEDVRETSSLRLVSLPRLEQHLKALMAEGKAIPDDVACLAGLTEVQFLFVFPETIDIVIGGPASDWKVDETGRSVSVINHRPTLKLDDLVTLNRAFSPGGSGFFMCSIDPKAEQVRAVREFVEKNPLTTQNVRRVTEKLQDILGLQNVIVQGIPDDSRVAAVIVEADYQMKRIGIGEREGAKGMKSYFELVSRAERQGSSMDALRWWMTVGYDSIQVAPDHQSFEFSGREVQCQSENQLVGNDGTRQATGKADNANAEFAQLFTQHLPELAQEDVVFADLQNVFDLGLATALVHTMGLNRQIGWQPEVMGVDGSYTPVPVDVPVELMTAANSRVYRGGEIVIQVAGGVRGDMRSVVRNPDNFEVSTEVIGTAAKANPMGQNGRWWWDASQR